MLDKILQTNDKINTQIQQVLNCIELMEEILVIFIIY